MFQTEFPAASADGFYFNVRADGRWRRRSWRQHDPESAAASYVIDQVSRIASDCPVLATVALERRANAQLGRPETIRDTGVRVSWAHVHIDPDPEVQQEALTRSRLRARTKADVEDKQLRIAQAVTLRDLLREDPTLALAQLLLESPEVINNQTTRETIKTISEQVATYAPGAAWVVTARLLENSFSQLPPDAKAAIVDRMYRVFMEFGEKEAAERIVRAHGLAIPSPSSNGAGNPHENRRDME